MRPRVIEALPVLRLSIAPQRRTLKLTHSGPLILVTVRPGASCLQVARSATTKLEDVLLGQWLDAIHCHTGPEQFRSIWPDLLVPYRHLTATPGVLPAILQLPGRGMRPPTRQVPPGWNPGLPVLAPRHWEPSVWAPAPCRRCCPTQSTLAASMLPTIAPIQHN